MIDFGRDQALRPSENPRRRAGSEANSRPRGTGNQIGQSREVFVRTREKGYRIDLSVAQAKRGWVQCDLLTPNTISDLPRLQPNLIVLPPTRALPSGSSRKGARASCSESGCDRTMPAEYGAERYAHWRSERRLTSPAMPAAGPGRGIGGPSNRRPGARRGDVHRAPLDQTAKRTVSMPP